MVRIFAMVLLLPVVGLGSSAAPPRWVSAEFDRLTTLPPGETAEALRRHATALALVGREVAALRRLDAALALAPDDATARACRAAIHLANGNADQARTDLDVAIRLHPGDPELFVRRAALRHAERRLELALRDLDAAVTLDADDAAVRIERGRVRLAVGRYDEALSDFFAAEVRGVSDESLALDRGRALLGRGEFARAAECLTLAVRHAPLAEAPLVARGLARERRGDWASARDDYERAAALHPEQADPEANLHLAWLLATCPVAKLRDGKRAVRLAEVYLSSVGATPTRVLKVLAAAKAEAGDFDVAVKLESLALEDRDYAKKDGDAARKRLERYRAKQPWRAE